MHVQSRHKRAWIITSFTIEEGHPGPFPYELGKIDIERAYRVYFGLYGEGVDEDPKGVLSIDKESGLIYVHKAVDYEEKQMLTLHFETKKSDFSLDTKLGVQISILDINDNPPVFQRSLYEITTPEDTAQGSFLMTVLAQDRDQQGSPNSTFHYTIKSASPQTENAQFFIDKDTGKISFKGCLDHEAIEAIDHGDEISLSSSTTVVIKIQDGNNHLPTISGQTGSGKVKEGESGTSPLRVHVTDRDSPQSPAWRARYAIRGADAQHFKIETDPETNDGILTVLTPLNYEETAHTDLTVSVENELPFFSCIVKKKTATDLWEVNLVNGEEGVSVQSQEVNVTIEVEDVNDPPAFHVTVKEAMLEENSPVGTRVTEVTAHDHDSSHSSRFVYKIGDDPAGWVQVDPKTGDITTVKVIDRESPHVVNGIYTVLIYAADEGEPPMTGTATVNIHVADKNDNVPQLEVDFVDVCKSENITTTNITAFDLDNPPFGGPFTFELLGDVHDKWSLNPSYGYTAGLVKESTVFVGPHTLSLKVLDLQGQFGIHSLRVTVCDCSLAPNCRTRRESTLAASSVVVGLVFLALLVLLAGLLLALFVTCEKDFMILELPDSEGTMLSSHMEHPGTDCKVPLNVYGMSTDEHASRQHDQAQRTDMDMEQNMGGMQLIDYSEQFSTQVSQQFYHEGNQWERFADKTTGGQLYKQQLSRKAHFRHNSKSEIIWKEAIMMLLHDKLLSLQEAEEQLQEDSLHIYREEGEDCTSELEHIPIPETDSSHYLNNLSPAFKSLAAICREHSKC
uniref:Cadherin domain-containing protein n=1 Tax=Knipowitschia caucasica TaxID=637954 RepID=A0AAV2M629_KNICA